MVGCFINKLKSEREYVGCFLVGLGHSPSLFTWQIYQPMLQRKDSYDGSSLFFWTDFTRYLYYLLAVLKSTTLKPTFNVSMQSIDKFSSLFKSRLVNQMVGFQ